MKEMRFKETEIGTIPEDWDVKEFRVLFKVPLRNGLTRPTAVRGSGIKMVNMGELFAYDRIRNIIMERVPVSDKEKNDYLLLEGDLLFARQSLLRAGVGKCSIFLGDEEEVTFEGHLIRVRLSERYSSMFYYYFFKSEKGKSIIQEFSEQVAASGIRGSDLAKIPVPVPSLSEQQSISKILSDLDFKIELNQQINKNLKGVGKTIFKHWFIDFDFPNEAGKPYKSSGGEMLYNEELGKEIPKGWMVGKTNEIARQVKEQVSPYEQAEKIYNHYSIEAYDSGLKPVQQRGSEILSSKFVVRDNTVLVSKLNPRIQRIWPVINAAENSICSTEFLVFEPRNNAFCYFYHLIFSQKIWQDMVQMARGTSSSHQRISSNDILDHPILIPPPEILESFERITFQNLAIGERNVVQQLTLQQIRDSLLPKLMSGKIRVPVEVS
jgi:type I restriction enzyme S subunit